MPKGLQCVSSVSVQLGGGSIACSCCTAVANAGCDITFTGRAHEQVEQSFEQVHYGYQELARLRKESNALQNKHSDARLTSCRVRDTAGVD